MGREERQSLGCRRGGAGQYPAAALLARMAQRRRLRQGYRFTGRAGDARHGAGGRGSAPGDAARPAHRGRRSGRFLSRRRGFVILPFDACQRGLGVGLGGGGALPRVAHASGRLWVGRGRQHEPGDLARSLPLGCSRGERTGFSGGPFGGPRRRSRACSPGCFAEKPAGGRGSERGIHGVLLCATG